MPLWLWAALTSAPLSTPSALSLAPLQESYRKGAAFLLTHQNADGSWGGYHGTSGFDVLATPPGTPLAFKTGTTALCAMALRRAGQDDPNAAKARDRALAYLAKSSGDLKRAAPWEIYNVWGHAFALQALSQALQDRPADPTLRRAAETHLKRLGDYETAWGGWDYYDFRHQTRQPSDEPTSFTTSTALVAFEEAERAGLAVPPALKRRAVKVVEKCRKPDGSYLYALSHKYAPLWAPNRDKGSLGRTQAGNFALFLQRKVTRDDLRKGLDRLFHEHRFIEIGRKRPYPHEAWYATAGYYYYYGHYYAGRMLAYLPETDRGRYRKELAAAILPHQEPNGSWWDFRMYSYHWAYGTAFALLTLDACLSSSGP